MSGKTFRQLAWGWWGYRSTVLLIPLTPFSRGESTVISEHSHGTIETFGGKGAGNPSLNPNTDGPAFVRRSLVSVNALEAGDRFHFWGNTQGELHLDYLPFLGHRSVFPHVVGYQQGLRPVLGTTWPGQVFGQMRS